MIQDGIYVYNVHVQKQKKKRKDDWRMAKLTFMGGIHPYDGKDLSKDKPMKAVLPKGDLVYPLSQHIGAPAVPAARRSTPRSWATALPATPST